MKYDKNKVVEDYVAWARNLCWGEDAIARRRFVFEVAHKKGFEEAKKQMLEKVKERCRNEHI